MEQSFRNSFSGSSGTLFTNTPSRSVVYHASTDASLFSASLPVLPHEQFGFNEFNPDGQSLDDGFPSLNKVRLRDEVKDLIEDSEPSIVGSFLPDDEDELFAGIMNDIDFSGLPTQPEDLDDDLFGSGGGLEIESENQENLVKGISRLSTSDGIGASGISHYGLTNGVGTISCEHPYGEHPSRTLFVRNINSNVEDSELASLFEQYGEIRTLYTACKHRGFVMISYYDIRAARDAMRGLQNKPLKRRKLDIHFSIPKDNPSEKDINQGTLVVFNLDASVSSDDLSQIFGAYGEIKEIRETPLKQHHKFIEFYDVRAAEAALKALNKSEIAGKRIKLEPSRPGGARRSSMQQLGQELEQDEIRGFWHHIGSLTGSSSPRSWTDFGSPVENNLLRGYSQTANIGSMSPVGRTCFHGLASILPSHASNLVKIAPIGKDPTRISYTNQIMTKGSFYNHRYSIPDPKLSSSPGPISPFSDPRASSVGTLSGPEFLWGSPTIHSDDSGSSIWSSSSKGNPFPNTNQNNWFHGSHHHVGSAPSGIQPEKHFGFFPGSPETTYENGAAFGVTYFHREICNCAVNIGGHGTMNLGVSFAGNFSGNGSLSSRMMPMPRNGPIYLGNGSFGGIRATENSEMFDLGRSKRTDSGMEMDNKKQYFLDLAKIINGEDSRTTLMIKNIPNKYTSKMLLIAIDETHKGTYDFLYLPIDFKNKCNVGYAFINLVSPSHIITFYEAFNGKRWEKFNSGKVASLAYARIQGKTALLSHFQNSSLMNEDKCCWPIVFQSDTQRTDDLETRS